MNDELRPGVIREDVAIGALSADELARAIDRGEHLPLLVRYGLRALHRDPAAGAFPLDLARALLEASTKLDAMLGKRCEDAALLAARDAVNVPDPRTHAVREAIEARRRAREAAERQRRAPVAEVYCERLGFGVPLVRNAPVHVGRGPESQMMIDELPRNALIFYAHESTTFYLKVRALLDGAPIEAGVHPLAIGQAITIGSFVIVLREPSP